MSIRPEVSVPKEQNPQLVTRLAREAVRRAAPDELPQFAVTAEAFFAAPNRVRRSVGRDEPLGLGLESVAVLVSTATLSVVIEVLKHLTQHYSDRLVARTGGQVRALLGRRRSGRQEVVLPVLDKQQLSKLHALAVSKATARQVPAEQAVLIADGIIAGLSLPDDAGE
ncbi:MAG: hypothetical protein ACT4NY_30935 [Pseudonocardiales bacterium]